MILSPSDRLQLVGATVAPRRLRIAFVVHDYNRRLGHSRYVAELASRFKHDNEVHVFANTFEEAEPHGLVYHHVPASRMNALASVLTFALPATWMTRGFFDVIHAQGFCGLRQNIATAHICQDAWHEAMTRNIGRPNWRKRLFHSLARRFERATFVSSGARRIIAVSRKVAADLSRCYGREDGIRVIYNGVDLETFHPRNKALWRSALRAQIGLSEETPLALYVGDYQKGLPAAIRAAARVPGLHLVGASYSPAQPYQALIRAERVVDRVHLLAATPHVERYYAAADLFVFPTFYDSFGLVATEAMASGLPVICSQAAGAAELIEDGIDGLLVKEPWDATEIAALLNRLTSDPALRRRLGEAGRKKVEAYSWDETARQTLAVYREICAD